MDIMRMTGLALAASFAATSVQAQDQELESQQLFQEVEGAYMMNVRLLDEQQCAIAQFTGPNVNMMEVHQSPSGARVMFFTPINPVAMTGRQDIRLDLSNGSASFDMTLDMEVYSHPNTANHWVLSSPISTEEAQALLISGRVTVTSSDGIRLTTLAAPVGLKTSAIRSYNACKTQF